MPAASRDTSSAYGAPGHYIELRQRYFDEVPELRADNPSKDDRSNAGYRDPIRARRVTHTSTTFVGSGSGAPITSRRESRPASSRLRIPQSALPESQDAQIGRALRATRSTQKRPDPYPPVSTAATQSARGSGAGGGDRVPRETGGNHSIASDEWEPSEADSGEERGQVEKRVNPMRKAKRMSGLTRENRVLRSHTSHKHEDGNE